MSFKVGMRIAGEKELVFNALRFATAEEAGTYGADLFDRWTLSLAWEVHESKDPVNYAIVDGKLVRRRTGGPRHDTAVT